MGWETRRGRRYYYRAYKVGGRVVKAYVGMGLVAEALATQDGLVRAERLSAVATRRAARARQSHVDDAVRSLDKAIDILVRASLVTDGYYRHHRGEWRRRRDG